MERGSFTIRVPLALEATLASGQAFRWRPDGRALDGFVLNRPVRVERRGNRVFVEWAGEGDPARALERYLRLDDPLEAVYRAWEGDLRLEAAARRWRGLRLLAQDPFETTVSFIASSASNIPKIARSVEKMCLRLGEPVDFRGRRTHAFPTPEAIASADPADLRACELGYRARYVQAAARAIAEGEVDLRAVAKLPTPEAQRALVEGLDGVGPKVAACALLFSMGKDDAFPVDRWVQRCVSAWYLGGRKVSAKRCEEWGRARFKEHAGYAQQYLFHDARAQGRAQVQENARRRGPARGEARPQPRAGARRPPARRR